MARLRFRVATVHFDEEEEVDAIEAVVRDDTLAVIRTLIDDVATLGNPRRGGTELTVGLDLNQVLDLCRAAGKTTGEHPDHEHTHEIYDSLSFVVYRMIERD